MLEFRKIVIVSFHPAVALPAKEKLDADNERNMLGSFGAEAAANCTRNEKNNFKIASPETQGQTSKIRKKTTEVLALRKSWE